MKKLCLILFCALALFACTKKQTAQPSTDMVEIPAGEFWMGADVKMARADEFPKHKVVLDSFLMDVTEVTNEAFAKFVEATGYTTTAEKTPDWEELKTQLPPGTPKPPPENLVAASLVFQEADRPIPLVNPTQWWRWQPGANWRHPSGPNSQIAGKAKHPVVQVSWMDAKAYCQWQGKRLPTEAEWEYAARGGLSGKRYPWGDEEPEHGQPKTNTWQGTFPSNNTLLDQHYSTAPIKTYRPNAYGLYDMAGNVWEWCEDWYRHDYYSQQEGSIKNPQGPTNSLDPAEPHMPKRVVRGGSFLCNKSYCSGYRVSARMKTSPDTGLAHTGFRCVKSVAR